MASKTRSSKPEQNASKTRQNDPKSDANAPKPEVKTLYRSGENKMVAGICGGMGEYLGMDPNLVRVGWVIGTLFLAGFGGILAYAILWYIIPPNPNHKWPENSAKK